MFSKIYTWSNEYGIRFLLLPCPSGNLTLGHHRHLPTAITLPTAARILTLLMKSCPLSSWPPPCQCMPPLEEHARFNLLWNYVRNHIWYFIHDRLSFHHSSKWWFPWRPSSNQQASLLINAFITINIKPHVLINIELKFPNFYKWVRFFHSL